MKLENHDLMKTTIINGDLIEVMRGREMEADVIVTSPPYNLGKKYGDGVSDKRKPAHYLSWANDWLSLLKVVLKPGGSLFLNVGSSPSKPLFPLELHGVTRGLFQTQNVIHWVKSIALPAPTGEKTLGHFKPINSDRYLNDTHEYIFHLTHAGDVPLDRKAKGVGTTYSDDSNIARWKHTGGGNMRCRGNNWFLPYKTIQSREKGRPHPATFPVELAERCIRLHGLDKGPLTVMDPFMGLGSTGKAAVRCGAEEFIGIDIVEFYCDLARTGIELTLKETL